VGSADFPACGFWRLSSRQFQNGNTELEAERRPAGPVNPQTRMTALHHLAPASTETTSEFGLNEPEVPQLRGGVVNKGLAHIVPVG